MTSVCACFVLDAASSTGKMTIARRCHWHPRSTASQLWLRPCRLGLQASCGYVRAVWDCKPVVVTSVPFGIAWCFVGVWRFGVLVFGGLVFGVWWLLVAGCWLLVAGRCWLLVVAGGSDSQQPTTTIITSQSIRSLDTERVRACVVVWCGGWVGGCWVLGVVGCG